MQTKTEDLPPASSWTWSIWTRRTVALFLFLALLTAIVLTGPVLPAILLAGLLVLVLFLPIRLLVRRTRLSYPLAIVLVLILYLVVLVGLLYLLVVPVASTFSRLLVDLQGLFDALINFLRQYTPDQGWITDADGNPVVNLNGILEPLSRLVKGEEAFPFTQVAQPIFRFLSGTVGSILNFILNILFIHLLAVYALFEIPAGFRWLARSLSLDSRREYALLAQRTGRVLGGYGRGILLNVLVSGTAAAIMLLLFRVHGAVGVALLATVFLFIPIIGGYIAGAIIFLSAFFTPANMFDLSPLLFGVVVYLAYTALQGGIISTFVEPRIYGSAVAIPVTVILIGVAVFGLYGGFLGMVLAVPILGMLREVLQFLARKLRGEDPYPGQPEPDFVSHSFLHQVGVRRK